MVDLGPVFKWSSIEMMVWTLNTRWKKAYLWSKLSSTWIDYQVTWHLNTRHPNSPVFGYALYLEAINPLHFPCRFWVSTVLYRLISIQLKSDFVWILKRGFQMFGSRTFLAREGVIIKCPLNGILQGLVIVTSQIVVCKNLLTVAVI